jgi:hypothetical protein
MHRPHFVVALLLAAALGAGGAGCRRTDAERRESEKATAAAEERAEAATLTSATLEPDTSARVEAIAAFRHEQADYGARLQLALDVLDKDLAHARHGGRRTEKLRDLRARRELLKGDLDLVNRSTGQDWATTRTKLDRDLGGGSGAPQ